jgi:hypothetical protein
MPERYELRAFFEIEDKDRLLEYARRRHRECYPPGTKDAPPPPRDVASALGDGLIDCKDGPPVEELGLVYLQSTSGPVQEEEEWALEAVRMLYVRTGGQGPFWEAVKKVVEASLHGTARRERGAKSKTER